MSLNHKGQAPNKPFSFGFGLSVSLHNHTFDLGYHKRLRSMLKCCPSPAAYVGKVHFRQALKNSRQHFTANSFFEHPAERGTPLREAALASKRPWSFTAAPTPKAVCHRHLSLVEDPCVSHTRTTRLLAHYRDRTKLICTPSPRCLSERCSRHLEIIKNHEQQIV